MNPPAFGSADFFRVPSAFAGEVPARLIHRNLPGGNGGASEGFSSERRHKVRIADLPSKALSMTLGGLAPNESTRRHRHSYETLIYVVSGRGKSVIGDVEVSWETGDAIYVPVWVWHHHLNTSDTEEATYIACENAPLLQNLGVAVREESD